MTNNTVVIPGRRKAANPESINPDWEYGFRARPFGPSRNDRVENFVKAGLVPAIHVFLH